MLKPPAKNTLPLPNMVCKAKAGAKQTQKLYLGLKLYGTLIFETELTANMAQNLCSELLRKFTGSVRTLQIQVERVNQLREEEGEVAPLLVDELADLDDFVRNDPQDTIFEEYDSPIPSETPFDWKSRRPSVLKSVVDSAWVVLQLIIWGGIILALFGVISFYVDINTADFCHWISNERLHRLQKSLRVAGKAFQGFLIEFWQFLILWTVFKWPLMKELNLLAITLLVAFVDLSYRLLLHTFHAYKSPWVPYPLNFLFTFLILYSSYAVGRSMFPESKSEALKLAFKLCAQFLFGIPVTYFLTYSAFSWFARTQPGLERMFIAAIAPMGVIPVKVVARICAIRLRGVNHPGTSHAIVAAAYGASSIVFRTLQAGIESFELFVVLSIGHGVVYIFERLTVPLRDYYWNKLGLWCCWCCCCRCCHRRGQYNVRTPRSQRLTADMSIQGMLFESTSIVYSIGVIQVYYLVYGASHDKWAVFRVEVVRRILVALAVEFVFNSIAVLFQIRYMNLPVIRVWRHNWRKHLILAFITTSITVVYYTEYMLPLIRAKYKTEDVRFPFKVNCTESFH